jgi:hypothetical protein
MGRVLVLILIFVMTAGRVAAQSEPTPIPVVVTVILVYPSATPTPTETPGPSPTPTPNFLGEATAEVGEGSSQDVAIRYEIQPDAYLTNLLLMGVIGLLALGLVMQVKK